MLKKRTVCEHPSDTEPSSDGSDDEDLGIPVVRGVPPPPIAVGVKTGSAKKRKKEQYKSEVRYNDEPEFQHGDKGTLVVRGDELPGVEWRTVPGFPQDRVLACSDGRVWAKDVNGMERTTRGKYTRSGRWVAKWAEPPEPQENLPGEIWVEAVGFKGRAQVSNMGRAWQLAASSKTKWGHKFTPKSNDRQAYATLGGQQFHRVVFFSFGGTLKPGETVDHIDRDPSNNKLDNLDAIPRRK